MKRITFNEMFAVGFCLFFCGISSVAFLLLSSSSSYAATTQTASASVTVGSACTLSAVENTAHSATIPSGTNQSDIGQTTFTMVCNDSGGFSLYAIGYGSNELGNTKLVAVINGATAPSYDINTGTNASGTPSSWAMKLTPGTNLTASNILNGYGSYSAIPSSYTKVATLVPTTSIVATSSLSATYRVNIAATQPAGNYNGKVRFVMVNPNTNVPNEPKTCSANKICYWPNGGDTTAITQGGVGVPDTMGDQSIASSATSAMLWASNFKRPGYGFAGWSDAYDYVINVGSESNPNAHIYGPNETIEFTAGQYTSPNQGLSLYAVWVKPAGYLQGWECPSNSIMPVGTVTALTDQRDNNTYAVAKLADGKCWMIENLRLDNTNSDNATGALAQGYGTSQTYGNFIGLANPETTTFTATSNSSIDPATANSIYYAGIQDGTAMIDISQTNYAGYRMPRFRNDNTNTDSAANPNTTIANMTDRNQNIYSYGNWYSWSAAKANTDVLNTIANSNGVGTSICPKGWSLPRGGDKANQATNEFWSLIVTGINNGTNPANYSSSSIPYYYDTAEATPISRKLRSYPNNFVYSSNVTGSSLNARGNVGAYWSAAAKTYYSAYSFYFSDGTVYPGTYDVIKAYGGAVRCVLEREV